MTWSYVFYTYAFIPLVAISYLALVGWCVSHIAALQISKPLKTTVILAILLSSLLLPVTDVIVGRAYFAHLCKAEAGISVVRTVRLDSELLLSDGLPKVVPIPGHWNYMIGAKYEMRFSEEQVLSWPRITEFVAEIRDMQSNEVIGKRIDFHYWGGWLTHQLPGHMRADSCPQLRGEKAALERLVFQPPQ